MRIPAAYIGRRVALFVLSLLGVTLLVFTLVRLVPGDAALIMAGEDLHGDAVKIFREALGLDQPYHTQYFKWMGDLVRGDLGTSFHSRLPIASELSWRLPNTLRLALFAISITILIGIPAGIISAARRDTFPDRACMVGVLIGIVAPVFLVGLVLQLVFSLWLGWLPTAGTAGFKCLILPGISVGLYSVANVARMTRASMIEVLSEDYIRTARSKGLPERTVLFRHALKNAMLPTITLLSLQFAYLMGGVVIAETIFAYSGMGYYLVQSIFSRDYPVVQAIILLIAAMYAAVNLVTDLLYAVLDPRVTYD